MGLMRMAAVPDRARAPLGLPPGSVRALLTLLVLGVVGLEMVRGRAVAPLWVETLMIALAHYFTSRRFVQLPPHLREQLEHEGVLQREANPLYLPRHTIRVAIVSTFVGLAAYLAFDGRLLRPEPLAILATVFAYLLGVVGRSALGWWMRGRDMPSLRWWDDAKALVVLGVLVLVAAAYVVNRPEWIPQSFQLAVLGLVLFYFGSR